MKKELKAVIAVVLFIWSFIMGFELGAYKESKAHVESNATTSNPIVISTSETTTTTTTTTTQPSTTESTTTQPSTDNVVEPSSTEPAPQDSTAPTQPTSSSDVSSLSKEQVIEKMNTYMAQLKKEQNMTATMKEVINVTVLDCSVPSATSSINNIVSGLVGDGPEENTYTFVNGQTSNGETPYALIPPLNIDFVLKPEGCVSAKAEVQGDNVIYTAVLVTENTTAASPVPTYNSTAIGYLDLMSLDIPTVSITSADMKYSGSTVSITVNSAGKVTHLLNELPMSGYGAATLMKVISGNATFEGGLNETWDFTY